MQIYEVKVLFYYSVLCHVQCLRCRRSEVKAELMAVSRDYLWPLPVSLYTALSLCVCVCVCVCVIRILMIQSLSNVHFSLWGGWITLVYNLYLYSKRVTWTVNNVAVLLKVCVCAHIYVCVCGEACVWRCVYVCMCIHFCVYLFLVFFALLICLVFTLVYFVTFVLWSSV